MRNVIGLTLLWALLFQSSAKASYAEFHPEFENTELPMAIEPLELQDRYAWLLPLLLHESYIKKFPVRSERSFVAHLKDSQKYFPHPSQISNQDLSGRIPYRATGKITYAGVYPAGYGYDLYYDSNQTLVIEVRVHFRPQQNSQLAAIKVQMQKAQDIWNKSRIGWNFDYRFKFAVVSEKRYSHFSVKLLNDFTRGPYFSKWSSRWSAATVAHELGHMMGLGDEYRTISGKMDCLYDSLMCSSQYGVPLFHHHYHILRRAMGGWDSRSVTVDRAPGG